MQDVVLVQVVHRLAHLLQSGTGLFLGQLFFHLYGFEEWALFHVLHHDVNVLAVTEEAIHFDDVGMIQEQANLDLSDELVQHKPHWLFLYLLYSTQKTSSFVNGWEDFAKTTFTLTLSQTKILYSKTLHGSFRSLVVVIACSERTTLRTY